MDNIDRQELIKSSKASMKPYVLTQHKNILKDSIKNNQNIIEYNTSGESDIPKHFNLEDKSDLDNFLKKSLKVENFLIKSGLPIYSLKRKTLNAVTYHNVFILQSPTGSGKSSLIPAFFMTSPVFYKSNVLVIEPKKISAIYLATKLKQELGGLVNVCSCIDQTDFNEGLRETIVFFDNRSFLSVLLEEMTKEFPLAGTKIILLDDLHELNVDIIISLAFLLDLIKTKRPDLRLIITSATLNEMRVEEYISNFLSKPNRFLVPPEPKLEMKCISVKQSEAQYDVQTFFLSECTKYFKDTIKTIERIISKGDYKKILVFLTCQSELSDMKQQLELIYKKNIEVYLLYAGVSLREQDKAMRSINPGIPVVVLATNYAESSITIKDLSHVIDCGREKLFLAESLNIYKVSQEFISKSSAIQRRGRAGREAPGICYCMYTEQEFMSMDSFRKTKIFSDLLDPILLELNKYKIDIRKLDLLFPISEEQLRMTYDKLLKENAIRDNNEDYLSELKDVGLLALELRLDSKLASMIIRTRFSLEAIFIAAVLRVYDTLLDSRKVNPKNKIFCEGFDDFTSNMIVVRQVFSIKCKLCLEKIERFDTFNFDFFSNFVDISCKICQDLRKTWSNSMKISWRSVLLALRYSQEILQKLQDRKINTYLEPTHYSAEFAYMNSKGEQQDLLIENYKTLARKLKGMFFIVFYLNLCENITFDDFVAFRHISSNNLGVPSSSSSTKSIHSSDFLIFFSMEKFKSKNYFKYTVGFSADEIKMFARRIDFCFDSERSEYEIHKVAHLGEKVRQLLKLNGSLYMQSIESSLQSVLTSFMIKYSKDESSLILMLKSSEKHKGIKVIGEKIKDLFGIIENKHRAHYSLDDNYLAVLGLGMEIIELISSKNELRYRIGDLDISSSASAYIKDIKNTFNVKFVNIERIGNKSQAILYFATQQQVEEAKQKLRMFPLNGPKGKIFEMEAIAAGAIQGKSTLIRFPCLVNYEQAENALAFCSPASIKQLSCTRNSSRYIVNFNSKQSNDYFINNYKHNLQEFFSFTNIEVKIKAEGISVPRELLKIHELEDYIEKIKTSYNCEVKINFREGKIFSQFEELHPAVQEILMRLVNIDTLEIVPIVWEEVIKSQHLHRGREFCWADFQKENSVSCVYIVCNKMVQIFGLPEGRCEVLLYLKKFCSSITSKLERIDLEIDHYEINNESLCEIYSRFPKLEIYFNESDPKKFTVFGLNTEIEKFLKIFYKNIPKKNKSLCQVCLMNQSGNSFKLSICGDTIHKSCFERAILNQSIFHVPIKCYICEAKVAYDDLLMILSFDTLQRIEKFALDSFIAKKGKGKYAYCEVEWCEFIYETANVNAETMLRYCPRCTLNVCIRCKKSVSKYHDNVCEKNRIKNQDIHTHRWIKENTVACPQCNYSVEKSGGCNHMICPKCEINYCFICFKKITEKSIMDHYSVKNTICYRRLINDNSV